MGEGGGGVHEQWASGGAHACVLGIGGKGGASAHACWAWSGAGDRMRAGHGAGIGRKCMPAGRQAEGRRRETLKSWQLLQLRSPLGASRRISVPPNSVLYTAFPSPVRPRLLSRSGVLSEVVKQKRGTSGFGSARSRRDVGSARPGSRCPG